jgi:hypothetical protein
MAALAWPPTVIVPKYVHIHYSPLPTLLPSTFCLTGIQGCGRVVIGLERGKSLVCHPSINSSIHRIDSDNSSHLVVLALYSLYLYYLLLTLHYILSNTRQLSLLSRMRLSIRLAVVGSALLMGSNAFTIAPGATTRGVCTPTLSMADAEVSVPATETTRSTSGLTMSQVRTMIDNLTRDNMDASLATMRDFLVHDAGATMYAKSLRRIARKAKALGATVPEGYAQEAKATQKKRDKQNAFIQTKQQAAADEAAAAADEAADAETVQA